MNRFKSITKPLTWFMALLLVAFVAGCGNGGDSPILGGGGGGLVSVTVTPATAAIPISGTKQFTATATYADGSSRDVTASATWVSGTSSNASIGLHTGIATGLVSGTSVITATFGGKSGSTTLTVSIATSVSFKVTPVTSSIPVTGVQQYTAIETFSDGTTQDRTAASVWTSSIANATVGSATGRATGITATTPGTPAIITATYTVGTVVKTAAASLTVSAAISVSFTVTPVTASVPVTGNLQFAATETFSDGSTQDRTAASVWTSSSTANATVDAATGLATGIAATAAGAPAIITATYTVGAVVKTATANLTVSAATSASFTVTPATASVPISGTQQFVAIETFSDGSTQDRTAASSWASSITNATVLTGGLTPGKATGITATTAGTPAIISATYTVGAVVKTATANLTVDAATSVSFKVTPATATTTVGGTQQYTAIETFSDGTTQDRTISSSWSTSGASAANATVGANTGIATGVTVTLAGTPVIVTATYTVGSVIKTATANLTVIAGTGPAPLAINLGTAATFGIAANAAMTSSGVTQVNGNIALAPFANTPSCSDATGTLGNCLVATIPADATGLNVNGTIYWDDGTADSQSATALAVKNDLNTAFVAGMAKPTPIATGYLGGEIGGKTVYPGIYKEGSTLLCSGNLGTTNLDAQGDANAIFIFQIGSSLTASSSCNINLANGTLARNVWFLATASATIGTGSTWNGNILVGSNISVLANSTVNGRLLAGALGAGVFSMTTTATGPASITINVPPN